MFRLTLLLDSDCLSLPRCDKPKSNWIALSSSPYMPVASRMTAQKKQTAKAICQGPRSGSFYP